MVRRISTVLISAILLIISIFVTSCSSNQDLVNDTQTVSNATQPGSAIVTYNPAPIQSDDINVLPSGDIKVMSINVYFNDPAPRGPGMVKLITDADPDSIGVQEFMGDWMQFFEGGLSQYDYVGFNVNGVQDKYCEANYIFYKKDKLKCLAWDTIWLTATPYLPSGNPEVEDKHRACTWAVFEDIETGFRYAHVNCHLESGSAVVNARQMPVIRDLLLRFASVGLPVFATGDFNTREGSDTYAIMVTDTGIGDTKYLAEDTMNKGTHHGTDGYRESTGLPIDYCFAVKDLVTVKKYEVIETWVGGMYVSDHNAVMATSTVNELPDQYMLIPNLTTDGITVNINSVRQYVADISFTQADDVFYTTAYRVWVKDKEGNEICARSVPSYNLDTNRPQTLNCTLTGLSPATEYVVYIAPSTIIGTYGNSVSFEIVTPPCE